jgi:hypothetical protein
MLGTIVAYLILTNAKIAAAISSSVNGVNIVVVLFGWFRVVGQRYCAARSLTSGSARQTCSL